MSILALTVFAVLRLAASYNMIWSDSTSYFEGGTLHPHLINLRGTDPEYLLICFEEEADTDFSGICETLELNIPNDQITLRSKEIFQEFNASDPFEIQIFNQGPTNNFLLAFTNGPYHNDGPGEILMGSFDDSGSLKYGTNKTVFNPGSNDQSRLIELRNDGFFIVCSSVGPTNQIDTSCRIAQYDIDSLSVTVGRKLFNMTQNHPTHNMVVERVGPDGFVACFTEYIQRFGACYVGTVKYNVTDELESDIIFSNEAIFHNGAQHPVDQIMIVHATQNVSIICYTSHATFGDGAAGQCQLAVFQQIAGFWSIVIIPEIFEFADHPVHSISIFHVNPNSLDPYDNNPDLVVVCYVDDSETNGVCKFGIVDLENYKIFFDDDPTRSFHDGPSKIGSTTVSYLGNGRNNEERNYLVVCYTQLYGSTPLFNRGFCKLGTITFF